MTLHGVRHNGFRLVGDAVEAISGSGGEIRTVTTTISDREYDLLCAELTWPMDLALLEGTLAKTGGLLSPEEEEIEVVAFACRRHGPQALMDANLDARGVRLNAVDYFHSGYHVWECD